MRGHVRRRGSKWCFVVDIGRDPNTGRRLQRWRSGFSTRKAAEEALRQALHAQDEGRNPFPSTVTLIAFVSDRWARHLQMNETVRAKTLEDYQRLLKNWVLPVIGTKPIAQVTPLDVQAVLDRMTDAGKSPQTVSNARAAISSVFSLALRWGLVSANPARLSQAPRRAAPKLKIPSPLELMQLIRAAEGTTWEVPVLLSATTGMRRSEVLGLRWTNVDLTGSRLRVVEGLHRDANGDFLFLPPKTSRGTREVPVTSFAVDRLRKHRTRQRKERLARGVQTELDLVCERDGRPINPDQYTYGFQRIAAAARLEGVRLHDLRHAVATTLANSGTPGFVTSALLGHASVSFTLATYTHVDEEQIDRAVRGLEQAFGA